MHSLTCLKLDILYSWTCYIAGHVITLEGASNHLHILQTYYNIIRILPIFYYRGHIKPTGYGRQRTLDDGKPPVVRGGEEKVTFIAMNVL